MAFPGLDIEHEAAQFPKKFAPHKGEVIKLLLEIGVQHHHLGKTQGKETQGVNPGHLADHAMPESGLADKRNVFRAVAHVEPAEKILIFHGNRKPCFVVLKVLEVGLDHGMHVTHLGHEQVLSLHHAIQHVVQRNCSRGCGCGGGALRDRSGRHVGCTWGGCGGRRNLSVGREYAAQNKNQHRSRTNYSHKNPLGVDHAN